MGAKRLFDITFSALGLLILSPILLIISVCILFESGRPVIFKQERLGKNWEPFILYKFRTMESRVDSEQPDCTSNNDKRVTKAGRFLRRYKLDEIPQLFNVLRGDMSFVGPRPELPKFAEHYSDIYRKILNIRPGITDLASIKFRNEYLCLEGKAARDLEQAYLTEILPEKLKYSMEYMRKRSFLYDLKLIFQTVLIVIFK